MPNPFASLAVPASQQILGNQDEDATDDQLLSPVSASSSGSTIQSGDDIEGTSSSQLPAEDPPSSEESRSHDPDHQPVEIEQHHEEDQHASKGDQSSGDDRGLDDDEDSGSENRAQASAFGRLFDGAQAAEHSVRETPPSIEGYAYRDQLPAYTSQPPSGVIVIPDVEDGAQVSRGGVDDMNADAVSPTQQAHEGQDEQTLSPLHIPSTLEQELQRMNDSNSDSDDLSDNSSRTIPGTGIDDVGSIYADQQVPGERQADAAEEPAQTTPAKLPEAQELPVTDKEGPEPPSSPSASSQDLYNPPNPIFFPSRKPGDHSFAPFAKGPSQRPGESMTDVIIRDQIRRCEAIGDQPLADGEKDVIRSYYRDMDRPRAPDEVSEPTSIHSAGALAEVDKQRALDSYSDASGVSHDPVSGMFSPSVPPAAYGTEIEDLRDESGRLNDLIGSLMSRLEEVEDRVDADKQQLLTAVDRRTANLFRKIKELEASQDEAANQLTYSYEQLHAASADIAKFQAEKKATQEKLETVERELQAVKMELHTKSKAEVSRRTSELGTRDKAELASRGTNEFDNKSNEVDNKNKAHTTTARSSYGPDPHLAESTQPPGRWFQMSIGFNSSSYVVLAIAALVWLVTEGMLHSKRLSDGYGPFINGGYNGLGSVVIFGTWPKFFIFYAVAVYLGVVSIRAAMTQ